MFKLESLNLVENEVSYKWLFQKKLKVVRVSYKSNQYIIEENAENIS